ncbi:GerAB/ArcD/ProY family transporter [Paenibacillus silviterrae]|uniref:GerAB/ArcD/ProY family transporter n=1 Tax=Paenibacillus silviterrae TaxID=3242194 RepID=UPI002543B95D|nr:endospore germination permease [Paenibacillus chinjuensis]
MTKRTITPLQAYMMLILVIGVNNHVILLPFLLETAKRDSWMAVVIMIIPALLWALLWYGMIKRSDRLPILHWIRMRYGTFAAMIVALPVLLLLLASIFVSLRDTAMWTHVSYLPLTPLSVIGATFLLLCVLAAMAGIESIAIISGIFLPGVVLLGYFVMLTNFQFKDYSLLTPLFTHGIGPTMQALPYLGEATGELMLLLFIQHHVKGPIRLLPLLSVVLILSGLTIGPLMGSISLFGPFESAHLRYPAFEQWRMVMIGKFISHLDFLSIYQWLSGAFIRISLMLFILSDIIPLKQRRYRNGILIAAAALIMGVSLLELSDMEFMQLLKQVYYPSLFAIWILLTALIALFAFLPAAKKEVTS